MTRTLIPCYLIKVLDLKCTTRRAKSQRAGRSCSRVSLEHNSACRPPPESLPCQLDMQPESPRLVITAWPAAVQRQLSGQNVLEKSVGLPGGLRSASSSAISAAVSDHSKASMLTMGVVVSGRGDQSVPFIPLPYRVYPLGSRALDEFLLCGPCYVVPDRPLRDAHITQTTEKRNPQCRNTGSIPQLYYRRREVFFMLVPTMLSHVIGSFALMRRTCAVVTCTI